MLKFITTVVAVLLAFLLGVGIVSGVNYINKPMTSFSIDTQEWSCSQTTDERILSCIKRGSV